MHAWNCIYTKAQKCPAAQKHENEQMGHRDGFLSWSRNNPGLSSHRLNSPRSSSLCCWRRRMWPCLDSVKGVAKCEFCWMCWAGLNERSQWKCGSRQWLGAQALQLHMQCIQACETKYCTAPHCCEGDNQYDISVRTLKQSSTIIAHSMHQSSSILVAS